MLHRQAFLFLSFLIVLWAFLSPGVQELPRGDKPSVDSLSISLPQPHHAPPIYAPLAIPPADMHYDLSPLHPAPAPLPTHFYLSEWSIYRRSFTLWGITFSTGHASTGVPSGAEPTAEVLSFPLNSGH